LGGHLPFLIQLGLDRGKCFSTPPTFRVLIALAKSSFVEVSFAGEKVGYESLRLYCRVNQISPSLAVTVVLGALRVD
jgi:hypothetical protein